MQALIQPKVKLEKGNLVNSTYQNVGKQSNSRIGLDLTFYQKLFPLFFTFCLFLIFPESPQNSEVLCKKYHSSEACFVW